ncbi:MAG: ATP-binding cassette domain-containing protein, partial [Clostridia bacterium]|nr:ATP-binding cassette domain-containing protein [Clostridia bacterium]
VASAERILEIENLPDEPEESCDIKEVEELKLSDVTFTYGREQLFKNVNLSVKKGEVTAIQGHSGIGKSTILLLLLGIYKPVSGKVLLKDKNIEIEAGRGTRKFFSFVPQGNLLFSGTIFENLLFSKEEANDDTIKEALRISGCDEFINQLPDGLDTKIGEGGFGLSEGQQQRIAIARALLSDAEILLLDEATSALDEKTEKEVIENLREINKTCILITHRKSPLSICDSAYILDEAGLNKVK